VVRVDIGSKTTFIVGPGVGASLATGKSRYPIARNTVKPVLRSHHWDKEKLALQDKWPLKVSMTGQEKIDH